MLMFKRGFQESRPTEQKSTTRTPALLVLVGEQCRSELTAAESHLITRRLRNIAPPHPSQRPSRFLAAFFLAVLRVIYAPKRDTYQCNKHIINSVYQNTTTLSAFPFFFLPLPTVIKISNDILICPPLLRWKWQLRFSASDNSAKVIYVLWLPPVNLTAHLCCCFWNPQNYCFSLNHFVPHM